MHRSPPPPPHTVHRLGGTGTGPGSQPIRASLTPWFPSGRKWKVGPERAWKTDFPLQGGDGSATSCLFEGECLTPVLSLVEERQCCPSRRGAQHSIVWEASSSSPSMVLRSPLCAPGRKVFGVPCKHGILHTDPKDHIGRCFGQLD